MAASIHDEDDVSVEFPVISGETLLCLKKEQTYVKENDLFDHQLPLLALIDVVQKRSLSSSFN